MRKMQQSRILRHSPEVSNLTLRSSSIEQSHRHTDRSTEAPEFSIVRAVNMCIERAIAVSMKHKG